MINTKLNKKYKLTLLILTLSLTLSGCVTDKVAKDKPDNVLKEYKGTNEVVAIVNGVNITDDDLMKYLNKYKKGIVENLIEEKIELLASESLGVTVTEADIEEGYNNYVEAIGDEEQFAEFIEINKTSKEGLKHNIASMLTRERTIDKIKETIVIAEEDLKALYDANKDQYKNIDALEVIVAKEIDLEKVKLKLTEGKTEEEITKEFGESIIATREVTDVTSNLGELGKELVDTPKGSLVIPEGDTGGEITIYRVNEVKSSYEDVKDYIIEQQKEILKYQEHEKLLNEFREKANIEYK